MLNSLPVRLLWRSLNWLTRQAIIASAVIAVPIAIAIIVLRYWLLPDIEQFHDRITGSLSAAMGNPVSIGRIKGDWYGLYPHLNFTDVHILDSQGQPALVLPRIDASVSWLSLVAAELRLSSLDIDRPELLIRRTVPGKIFIGGIPLITEGTDNNLANWLLHQPRMVVRNAIIVWLDEQRGAPPLVLDQVNLHIESLLNHHQFALRAVPPIELATPLDVRGDFQGTHFDEPDKWQGQLFAQLDYTDLLAWRPWLKLPAQLSRGRGALRGWLGVQGGQVTQLTADLALRDVATRLAENTQEMDVQYLRGRAAWKTLGAGWEVSTRQLALRMKNKVELQPTDFYFRTVPSSKTQAASGALRANSLQLESLVSLANFFPLDAKLHSQLVAYAPRGLVSNLDMSWQGPPEKLLGYKVKGQFENFSLHQVGKMPGFSGLSVAVDGSEASGHLNINTRNLTLDAPGVMREPLLFNTLTGQASWQREQGELAVRVENVAVANNDLAGNLYGSFKTRAGTKGVLDLTISLTRGDIRRAARYTPLVALDKKDNDWLNDALLSGHTEDFHLRIKGNLSDFPLGGTAQCADTAKAGAEAPPTPLPSQQEGDKTFENAPAPPAGCASSMPEAGGAALLEISAHAQDVAVEFARDWPRIENISGDFFIHGNKLEVKSPSATILDARIHNLTITLPDMMDADMPLEIRGEADASNNTFMQFIQQSPVRGYIDGFTDGMSASGNGHLDLFTRIPLLGVKPVKVSGTLRVQASDMDLGAGVPWLRNTRGELSFTESGMHANNVTAEILGGAARLNVQTAAGGVVLASMQGRTNLDALRKTEKSPLLGFLHGDTSWDASISVVKKTAQVILNSNLQGLSSSLPQPFTKSAHETWPLRIEKKNLSEREDRITAQLGKLVSARLIRFDENGASVIKRGVISFGEQGGKLADTAQGKKGSSSELITGDMAGVAGQPGRLNSSSSRTGPSSELRNGVWLVGRLPVLSLQGWDGVFGNSGQAAVPIAGANLHIDKITGFGLNLNGLQIDAAKRGNGLAAQLSGTQLNGEVVWQPENFAGAGKISAHLRNLYWLGEEQANLTPQAVTPVPSVKPGELAPTHPHELPAMEITIEDLLFKGKQIGHLELVGFPDGRDWRLRRLRITNPDGSVMGDGLWHGAESSTQLNLLLEISNAGKILARSGYPNTVKNGSGKLSASLTWDGQPDEFNYASLDGTIKLDTGRGQFLKMDPGIGKLLGILSLQALPKRITLDFTDVFSAGFEFDNINGNASIRQGVMQTQDLHIDGSAAKVTMKGRVNLNDETQNLRVVVLPTLGDSVSLLSAFAAGPVVGIGALIASKILGSPLDKLMSFEYNVSGTWSNPSVVKVGEKPVKLQSEPKNAADKPKITH